MKKTLHTLRTLLVLLAGTATAAAAPAAALPSSATPVTALDAGFAAPPSAVRTSIYWYWINDNVSAAGVVADLHAMKKAGIARAFIGNIGKQSYAYGKTKFLSEDWWDALRAAFKTAGELDIEIGLFNCPGWSQAGGPWVKPEQAMRRLAVAERHVTGPVLFSEKLPPPTKHFQDVKVLAFPAPPRANLLLADGAKISVSAGLAAPRTGAAGPFRLPSRGKPSITLALPKAAAARSLVITPAGSFFADCELLARGAGEKDFRQLKRFNINRTNSRLITGFNPEAPAVISLPEKTVAASEYKIVFSNVRQGSVAASIQLSTAPILERFPEKTFAKMWQTALPAWDAYLWGKETADTAGSIPKNEVRDISKNLAADGTLTWQVPAGEWIIQRTGMTPTGTINSPASPEATGFEVDKTSRKHIVTHFDAFIGEILRRIPANERRTFKVVIMDSYETGGQNFTDGFIQKFKQRYGYDPVPFLPAYQGYCVGSPEISDRFLWDMRRFIADNIASEFVAGLRDESHKHGLTTWLENYGHWGFPAEFLQYGGQADEIGGEFWAEGPHPLENRAASSSAHIYGKNLVSSESFTSRGGAYMRHPGYLKRIGDYAFTEGINNTLLHVYIHQNDEKTYPGVDAWFGTEFNRKNTWFTQIDSFIEYTRRCNFMLRQGRNVADVAYFIGEDTPKMAGITDPTLPDGYAYDFINGEVILRDLSVKDGKLVLPHGTSYRVLVLPPQETMRPELLQKIEKLVADGAVVVGPPPKRSPSLENYPDADNALQAIAKKLWGEKNEKVRAYGKGKILRDVSLRNVFEIIELKQDFRAVASGAAEGAVNTNAILYAHRSIDDAGQKSEIYFVTNQTDKTVSFDAEFRVKKLSPELWDAVSGVTRPLPAFRQNKTTTIVPLRLEANASAFVVFRSKRDAAASGVEANFPAPVSSKEITAPWRLRFESDWLKRGPAETIVFPKLQDLSKHTDSRIRFYSGTVFYNTTFSVSEKLNNAERNRLVLDLGKVAVMAKVRVNGQFAGAAWTPPFHVDISKFVKAGDNTLEVEVVNTWVNRIIGDQQLPGRERKVAPRHNPWRATSILHEAGLLGPVKLLAFEKNVAEKSDVQELAKSEVGSEEDKVSRAAWTYNFQSAEGKPYFHPLSIPASPDKTPFSNFRPADHKWHLGLWFSWKFVNGVNFWEPDKRAKIRIVEQNASRRDDTDVFNSTLAYCINGKEVLREKRVVTVRTKENGNYSIDWDASFSAVAPKVVFERTKPGKNKAGDWASGGYAGLCIRFADEPTFSYSFTGESGASGATNAKLCGFAGKFVQARIVSRSGGAAAKLRFESQPESADYPTVWFTRHAVGSMKGRGYYVLGSAPIFHKPLTLEGGASAKPMRLRYKITVERE
ncbi:MAG: PmoA family protein [Puniceicoccales bacterium]|nr:PmoA family protein [Puniceicoccales bacterium]